MSESITAPLPEREALTWLVQNSPVTVAAYRELGDVFGWDKTKTWKVIQKWRRKGWVETETAADTGRLTVTVVPTAVPIAVSEDVDEDGGAAVPDTERMTSSPLTSVPDERSRPAVPPGNDAAEPAINTVYATYVPHPRDGGEAPPVGFLDVGAIAVALALAAVAGVFAVIGMGVLFPGLPTLALVLGVTLEVAKFVTASWLGARWGQVFWVWRWVIATLVLNLAFINATAVYSQLVAGHVGRSGEVAAGIETRNAEAAARIEVATAKVADFDKRLAQIDSAVAEATRRGRTKSAMAVMRDQRKARAALEGEREKAAEALAALKTEGVSVAATGRATESESAPVRYVAQLFGITDPESVIRLLIAAIVMSTDPLGLALAMGISSRRFRRRKGRA